MQLWFFTLGLMTEQEALDAGAIEDADNGAFSEANFDAATHILLGPTTDGALQASKQFDHELLVRLNKLHAGMEPDQADQLAK